MGRKHLRGMRQLRLKVVQGHVPPGQIEHLGLTQTPGVLRCGQAQIARCALQCTAQGLPVGQAFGMLQAAGQHVAAEIDHLRRTAARAEELHPDFGKLMRLVENQRVCSRQQFGHAFAAQRQIGEKQMVIDDHHVGGQGLAARLHHKTGFVVRAVGPEAVVGGGGDEIAQRRVFFQPRQRRQIAARIAFGELRDAAQLRMGMAAVHPLRRAPQAVEADVIRAAFEHAGPHRCAQRTARGGQILVVKLILQIAGRGGNDHPPAMQQRGHEISQGFARARTGFRHEDGPVGDGPGHRHRQLSLPLAHRPLRQFLLQRAAGRKQRVAMLDQSRGRFWRLRRRRRGISAHADGGRIPVPRSMAKADMRAP